MICYVNRLPSKKYVDSLYEHKNILAFFLVDQKNIGEVMYQASGYPGNGMNFVGIPWIISLDPMMNKKKFFQFDHWKFVLLYVKGQYYKPWFNSKHKSMFNSYISHNAEHQLHYHLNICSKINKMFPYKDTPRKLFGFTQEEINELNLGSQRKPYSLRLSDLDFEIEIDEPYEQE